MQGLWQDIRYGFKLLVKNPGFTAAAIFSLTIGIGLNSTIFCLVDRLILQPLPVERPDELVLITIRTEKGGLLTSLPYPEYLELRNQCKALSGVIGSARHGAILSNGEVSEFLLVEIVTRNYFSVLGVKPHLGRVFRDGDKDATAAVAVISYGLWQRRFGGDPAIVGKAIELTRRQVTVIGIAPRGFGGTDRPRAATDVWYPAEMWGSSVTRLRGEEFDLLGRVAAGISIGRALAEVDAVVRRLTPSNLTADRITGASVASEAKDYFRKFGILGLFLMAVTGLILLIACVNVSNLLLARSQARRKEIAVRLALGGSRLRLTRQLLTEGFVLSLASAAVGWLLTRWAVQALPALLPPMPVRMLPEITLDARVLGFTIGLAFLSTLVFALIPALHASKLDLVPMLSESAGMGSFGLLGLILASFGLYGIVSYTVSQRTREIGLRMALGAQRGDALRMVLRQGLTLALSGAALGLPLAMVVSHYLRSVLYQVSPTDPVAVGGTVLLLAGVALFASYIPARRATKVDPIVALRHQ
jgi:putative ABC transport system permease protein